jgi:hypothetical protein
MKGKEAKCDTAAAGMAENRLVRNHDKKNRISTENRVSCRLKAPKNAAQLIS